MHVDAVVIGAGHAGLAVSRLLTARSIEHVVLERGEVAQSWRTQRWDSLRLLTPNWLTRLPGLEYDGDDPDGFMTMPEVIDFIDRYALLADAPVRANTRVTALRPADDGFRVETDRGEWTCRTAVLATGGFNLPRVPPLVAGLPNSIDSVTPYDYRRPSDLAEGGVLVVGASATGIQLAEEIHASGRPVTLAVGEHVRMVRTYRGKDVQWWMLRTGRLDERYDQVEDLARARRVPSPQLIGSPERRTLDLNGLAGQGVRLAGRLAGVSGATLQFSGSLRNKCQLADLKLGRLLDEFDEWARQAGCNGEFGPAHRPEPTRVEDSPLLTLDLSRGEIKTVLWATGFDPDYSWLEVPVLDRKGRLRHQGGVVTDWPGMYRIGLNFLRRRKSSFIHGAGDDARDLVDHLESHLRRRVPAGVC